MQQVLFHIPWTRSTWFPDGIPIYGFGMMLFLAFLLCTWLAGRRITRALLHGVGLGHYTSGPLEGDPFPQGEKPAEKIDAAKALAQDLAIWLFVTGLLGARLTYMYHHPAAETGFFAQLVDITNGGIILYGAVAGALLGYGAFYLYYLLKHKVALNTLRIADIAAPSVAIGICLGRIGCLLNGCCYGQVACADCRAVYPIEFPMSAPPRYVLVEKGYQTAAGFTVAETRRPNGVTVGTVEPDSPAWNRGLRPGAVIVGLNGKSFDGIRAEMKEERKQQKGKEDAQYNEEIDHLSDARILDLAFTSRWKRGEKDVTLTVAADGGEPRPLESFRPYTLGLYPTQLFESVSMVLLFLLLWAYFPFRSRDGQVVALLMICYAAHRSLNEMLRGDQRPVGFEAYSSYFLLAAGVVLFVWLLTRPAQFKGEWELK